MLHDALKTFQRLTPDATNPNHDQYSKHFFSFRTTIPSFQLPVSSLQSRLQSTLQSLDSLSQSQ